MWFLREREHAVAPRPGPWDSGVTGHVQQVAAAIALREVRSLLIDQYLASRTFSAGIYTGGRIKASMEARVRKSMDISNTDTIKIVFDGTAFGSAKNGFVASIDGLYWKEFWGSPQFTNWQALSVAQSNRRLAFRSSEVVIDNAKIAMTFGFYSAKDVESIITGILAAFHGWSSHEA